MAAVKNVVCHTASFVLGILLTVAMIPGLAWAVDASESRASSVTFSDVNQSTPHYEDILWLASAKISTGFPDGTFRPYASIARCDMAAFLRRLAVSMGVEEAKSWNPSSSDWAAFSDVSGSTPHAEDILWLASTKISTGFPDGTFRPYASIARCDMAAFLQRLAVLAGRGQAGSSGAASFTDVSSATPHYAEVQWLASTKISTGFPDGTFRPYASIARCDMAAFLYRLNGLEDDSSESNEPSIPGGSDTQVSSMSNARDFFNYVGETEGNYHGDAALTIIDIDNPEGINSWYIVNTGTSMDGVSFPAYTDFDSATDASSIENMYVALDVIDECNRLRALEGLPALKVSDCGMAVAMVNANWTAAYFNITGNLAHAAQFGERYNWSENIAWGYSDPVAVFRGWYWQEKANYIGKAVVDPDTRATYQPQSGGETGHYLTIVNPSYTVAGAGFSMNHNQLVFAQEFKAENTIPRPDFTGNYFESGVTDDLYTVDEYRARLDAAVKAAG